MSLILFLSTLDSSIPISSSCFHQEFPLLLHIRQFEVVLTSFIHGTCLLFSTQDRILWPFFLHSSSMFSCCGLSRYAAKASVQNRDIRYETEHKPLITLLTVLFLNKHTLTLSMFKQRAFLLHIIYYTLYLDRCVCVCVSFWLEESSASLSLADLYRFSQTTHQSGMGDYILTCHNHFFFFPTQQEIVLDLNLILGFVFHVVLFLTSGITFSFLVRVIFSSEAVPYSSLNTREHHKRPLFVIGFPLEDGVRITWFLSTKTTQVLAGWAALSFPKERSKKHFSKTNMDQEVTNFSKIWRKKERRFKLLLMSRQLR